MELICNGCKKSPDKISEYIEFAKIENCTPQEFVLQNEGTLNSITGQFLCTKCYLKKGEPLGITGAECFDGSQCTEAHQDCNICVCMR